MSADRTGEVGSRNVPFSRTSAVPLRVRLNSGRHES
jgi:hypothetical protein